MIEVSQFVDAVQQGGVVAFTGAGISTESGIPDFRSPGGVWSRNRTIYFDEFCRSPSARYEYWRQKSEAHQDFAGAHPNVAHQTLVKWQHQGLLQCVITQNIDGLHTAAGTERVLELHGTAREVQCLDCSWRDRVDRWVEEFLVTDLVPVCPQCAGRLKHATVSFGQRLPEQVLEDAVDFATSAKLFFVIGSSLVVEPAASLPRIAKEHGATLAILNRDPTPLDAVAHFVYQCSIGEFFHTVNQQWA